MSTRRREIIAARGAVYDVSCRVLHAVEAWAMVPTVWTLGATASRMIQNALSNEEDLDDDDEVSVTTGQTLPVFSRYLAMAGTGESPQHYNLEHHYKEISKHLASAESMARRKTPILGSSFKEIMLNGGAEDVEKMLRGQRQVTPLLIENLDWMADVEMDALLRTHEQTISGLLFHLRECWTGMRYLMENTVWVRGMNGDLFKTQPEKIKIFSDDFLRRFMDRETSDEIVKSMTGFRERVAPAPHEPPALSYHSSHTTNRVRVNIGDEGLVVTAPKNRDDMENYSQPPLGI